MKPWQGLLRDLARIRGKHLQAGLALGFACAVPTPATQPASGSPRENAPPVSIPLEFIDHFAVLSARLDDAIDVRLILDTGIGVTVLSSELCQRAGCRISGEYTGERMSGQRITIPLARVGSLAVAARREQDVQIGVIDGGELLPSDIDGILSLGFFETGPFTIDYRAGSLTLDDDASLRRRLGAGVAVPAAVERDAATVTVFLALELPGGHSARVEVDTGSNALILDQDYMRRLGVDPADPGVARVVGTDETGHPFVRHFAVLDGAVRLAAAPQIEQVRPRVMFQDIIHDGLIGAAFLRDHAVTFDLAGSRMIFGESAVSRGTPPDAPPPTPRR